MPLFTGAPGGVRRPETGVRTSRVGVLSRNRSPCRHHLVNFAVETL